MSVFNELKQEYIEAMKGDYCDEAWDIWNKLFFLAKTYEQMKYVHDELAEDCEEWLRDKVNNKMERLNQKEQ